MIRTKIIATMGPAVADPKAMYALLKAGVDVCRLNFSHGNLDDHLKMLRIVREAALRVDHPIAVLGDLGGPKIRLDEIAEVGDTGGMPIDVGQELTFVRGHVVGKDHVVSSTYETLVDDVKVGDRVLIEDGMLRFVCVDKARDKLVCRCTHGGVLKTRKGINLPTSHVNLPSITEKDWRCVDWAIENGLDYVALSFVRTADELGVLREHLRNRQSDLDIVSKIEKAEAIEDIERIVDASDAVMVARGDLGVEMDLARVPIIQKDIIRRCQRAGKPVIVATQMLQSMIEQPSPTRAEVSDVANAIFDGTDAVMLSGETSVGKFAVAAVHTMSHVAEATEAYLDTVAGQAGEIVTELKTMRLSGAIARSVRRLVADMKCKLVVVYTQTGDTARIFAKHRFTVPVIALSSDHRALRRMSLNYGISPLEMEAPTDLRQLVHSADELVQTRELAEPGDRIIVVAGQAMGAPGAMNGIVVHTVGTPQTDPCEPRLDLRERRTT